MSKKIYKIDGNNFSSLDGFYKEISETLIPSFDWGKNLDAFNDILYGGFGTPDEGFILVWRNSEVSKRVLGYGETVNWMEKKLLNCHSTNVQSVKKDIDEAKQNKGQTLFDIILEILNNKEHSDIELRLE